MCYKSEFLGWNVLGAPSVFGPGRAGLPMLRSTLCPGSVCCNLVHSLWLQLSVAMAGHHVVGQAGRQANVCPSILFCIYK
jgi:hypothetical protein